MKKFFQSKGFIVSSLALLCITILGVCWFVSRDRTGDFRPDESPPSSVTGDWSDGGTQTDGDNGADAYAPGQSTDAKEYLDCIREELPHEATTGFRFRTITQDPAVRKAVDDIVFDFYGEENPCNEEDYNLAPSDEIQMGGM